MKEFDDRPEFVIFTRNLCHFSMARHPAATPRWRAGLDGYWRCKLHDGRVVLSLPARAVKRDPELLRMPNRFDMDLLLRLTALTAMLQTQARHDRAMKAGRTAIKKIEQSPEADRSEMKYAGSLAYWELTLADAEAGSIPLSFPSIRGLVRWLERDPSKHGNREAVRRSLRLWRHLGMEIDPWEYRDKKPRKRTFKPVFETLSMPESGRGKVVIELTAYWMEAHGGDWKYWLKVPFPLPLGSEAALNLSMFLPLWARSLKFVKTCPVIGLKELCDKIGIVVDERGRMKKRLAGVLKTVNNHLRETQSKARRYRVRYGKHVALIHRLLNTLGLIDTGPGEFAPTGGNGDDGETLEDYLLSQGYAPISQPPKKPRAKLKEIVSRSD